MLNIKHLIEPPADIPKAVGIDRAQAMLAAPRSGWALRVGFDVAGQPIHLFRDEIQPPNALRRVLTQILTGMKWEKA